MPNQIGIIYEALFYKDFCLIFAEYF